MIPETLTGHLGPSDRPNCGVTAVAVVSGRPFNEVFEFIKGHAGRTGNWQGRTRLVERLAALDAFQVPYEVVFRYQLRGQRRTRLSTLIRWLDPNATYLMDVTGHSFVLRGGKIVDQYRRDWTPVSQVRFRNKLVCSVIRIKEVA